MYIVNDCRGLETCKLIGYIVLGYLHDTILRCGVLEHIKQVFMHNLIRTRLDVSHLPILYNLAGHFIQTPYKMKCTLYFKVDNEETRPKASVMEMDIIGMEITN